MHGLLPEATQLTTVPIKFVPHVSDLPSSVEAQTSATRASTSVVFAPAPLRCTLTVALHRPSLALHIRRLSRACPDPTPHAKEKGSGYKGVCVKAGL